MGYCAHTDPGLCKTTSVKKWDLKWKNMKWRLCLLMMYWVKICWLVDCIEYRLHTEFIVYHSLHLRISVQFIQQLILTQKSEQVSKWFFWSISGCNLFSASVISGCNLFSARVHRLHGNHREQINFESLTLLEADRWKTDPAYGRRAVVQAMPGHIEHVSTTNSFCISCTLHDYHVLWQTLGSFPLKHLM